MTVTKFVVASAVLLSVASSGFAGDYDLKKAEPVAHTSAPKWFTRMPDDTPDMIFAAATAVAPDEQMAIDKARLQAERKLVEMHRSLIVSQTNSNRSDTGGTMSESTTITVQKNANGELIGAQRVDSQVECFGPFNSQTCKAYVLLRLPMGDNNTLRKERVNVQVRKEAELRAGRAQQELEKRRIEDAKAAEAADAKLKAELGPKPEVSVAPAAEAKIEQ
jgi:hypothetical protein